MPTSSIPASIGSNGSCGEAAGASGGSVGRRAARCFGVRGWFSVGTELPTLASSCRATVLPCQSGVGSARRRQVEQRVRGDRADLARVEQPDDAVLAVEARRAANVTGAQPPDRLTEQLAADSPDVVERCLAEHVQLGAEGGDERIEPSTDRPAARTDAVDLAQDLGQLYQVFDVRVGGRRRPSTVRLIGEILDPAEDADRHRLVALDAHAVALRRLCRGPAHPAGAVTVRMVFALFGEELQRPGESDAGAQGLADAEIVEAGGEDRRLPAERGQRVGVRIGHQLVSVEAVDTRQFIAGSLDRPVSTAKMWSARSA